jgi:hypothetical protein
MTKEMGSFQSKKQTQSTTNTQTQRTKNNNITLLLRGRESGKKGSNSTGIFMENYISQILLLYPENALYRNGPTYKECIGGFRSNVPVNCSGYEHLLAHFNWLRFQTEPLAFFMACHVNDFVGHMQLETVHYLAEHEPLA